GILSLSDDAVREPEQRRNGAEGQPRRHQERRVYRLRIGSLKNAGYRINTDELAYHLAGKHEEECKGRGDKRWDRDKCASADEIERRHQAQRSWRACVAPARDPCPRFRPTPCR